MPEPLLAIQDLSVAFYAGAGTLEAVSGVNLVIHRGEAVSLVGESGSGKTVTALTIARLLSSPPVANVSGHILFEGEDLVAASEARLRTLRGRKIAYVFQEPGSALNPVLTVGYQIAEAVKKHNTTRGRRLRDRVATLLADVGLTDFARMAKSYPHQLSGGQQQRIMLAMALACEPDLLIADEPTTALDVTVQAQILDLMKAIQSSHGMAVLLITHNLAIAARMASRMYVMYAGQTVEEGPSLELLRHPRHPYTRALMQAVPRLRGDDRTLLGIPGQIPAGVGWPSGCRFHPRCPMAKPTCSHRLPDLNHLDDRRASRCFYSSEVLPP